MKTTLQVNGMSCGNCETSVINALKEIADVENVKVDLNSGKVDITFENGKVEKEQLEKAIEDQGFDVVN